MNPAKRPVALVTGASSGIGLELCKVFAADGFDLILVARGAERLHVLARELETAHGARGTVLAEDLADPGAPGRIAERVSRDGVALEALVNNAGFGQNGAFLDVDWAVQLRMLQVNLHALTELTRRLAPDMVARGRGRIMNVSSAAGFVPGPGMAVYYASKAYVTSLGEALAHELRGTGVTVTTLCPGPTDTGFAAAANTGNNRLFRFMPVATAESVARRGYAAMKAGKTLVIPGLANWLMIQSLRVSPRFMIARVAAWLQGGGH
jgi:short-subunit dehydrogenase